MKHLVVGDDRGGRRRISRARMIAVLPTLITLGNGACGFGAITFAAKVGPEQAYGNHLLIASLLIYLGMVFDMLDGSAARWTRQTSDLGAQLDSLCDAISFGIAPAFLMIQFVLYDPGIAGIEPLFHYHPRLLWVIGLMFALCALLRLARFNVETDEDDSHEFFSGLPSPAAAGTVASFPLAMHGLMRLVGTEDSGARLAVTLIPTLKLVLPLITLSVAFLMVSRVRYPHLFNQLFRGRRNRMHVIQLLFAFGIIVVMPELAMPLIFGFFAFAAPLRSTWQELTGRRTLAPKDERAENAG